MRILSRDFNATLSPTHARVALQKAVQCLEVMLAGGWVSGKLDKKKPRLQVVNPDAAHGRVIHLHDPAEERPSQPAAGGGGG